jgi:hypothetical protein
VLLEPCINVSHQVQAENRIFRLGQTKDVHIHFLLSTLPRLVNTDAAATSIVADVAAPVTPPLVLASNIGHPNAVFNSVLNDATNATNDEKNYIETIETAIYKINEGLRSRNVDENSENQNDQNNVNRMLPAFASRSRFGHGAFNDTQGDWKKYFAVSPAQLPPLPEGTFGDSREGSQDGDESE